jgi:hypothetical protein
VVRERCAKIAGRLRPADAAGWRGPYDYNANPSIGATFQTLPGASFVVNGAAQSHNKALTTASAEVK